MQCFRFCSFSGWHQQGQESRDNGGIVSKDYVQEHTVAQEQRIRIKLPMSSAHTGHILTAQAAVRTMHTHETTDVKCTHGPHSDSPSGSKKPHTHETVKKLYAYVALSITSTPTKLYACVAFGITSTQAVCVCSSWHHINTSCMRMQLLVSHQHPRSCMHV